MKIHKKKRPAGPGPKPPWLRKRIAAGDTLHHVHGLVKGKGLHTVCQEAHCPNLGECYSSGTATLMILGDRCTRNCRFCAVTSQPPLPPDPQEPERAARAIREMGLTYAVITSVTRDDLADGGAGHFAACIREVRRQNPGIRIEVLIPDFKGDREALHVVAAAAPEVINHNLETVARLYGEVRPQADYHRSLQVFEQLRDMDAGRITKSGLMLGLGETAREIETALCDLHRAGCHILTLGQYLAPSREHHPVDRYVPPDEFSSWEKKALEIGFAAVASAPFVRSSYRAGHLYDLATRNRKQGE
jgi:lipoic acid synthetase